MSRSARAEPTIVASSPIARCRKPPTFALAYISPARSSKRRMSSIVASHSRATSGSGSGWSAIVSETSAAPSGIGGRRASSRSADRVPPAREELVGVELREVGRAARARAAERRSAGSPRTGRPRRCRSPRPRCWSMRSRSPSSAGPRRRRVTISAVGAAGLHADGSASARGRLLERVVAVEQLAVRRRPPAVAHAAPRAVAVAASSAAATAARSSALSTARGCISHAAAAIRTLSGRRARARRRRPGGTRRARTRRAADLLGVGRGEHRELGVERERSASAAAAGRRCGRACARHAVALDVAARRVERSPPGSRAPGSAIHSARPAAPAAPARRRGRPRGCRGRGRRPDRRHVLAVDQPAVGGAGGLHHGLGERRVAVDHARDLGVAALERA